MHQNDSTTLLLAASAGGEQVMAGRVRAIDWSRTPLGPMGGWPQSLRTAVGICLNSPMPMSVWWGPDLINIYNDAYAPVLGNRHPDALGQPARQVWADIWPAIADDVEAVVRWGVPVTKERVRFVTERNGYPEETFFSYSHSPIPDDSGGIGGVFQVCTDETRAVLADRDRERLSEHRQRAEDLAASILESVTDGFFALDEQWRFTYANAQAGRILSRPTGELIGKVIWDEYPGLHGSVFEPVYRRAMGERVAGSITSFYPDHDCWYDVRCYPSREGVSVYFQNVTELKRSEVAREVLVRTVEHERSRLRAVIEQAPAFICTLRGPEHVFELANERYYEIVGKREIIGKTVRAALPELEGQGFFELLDHVYRAGETFAGNEMPVLLKRRGDGPLDRRFMNLVYQPLREADGTVSGIFVHGIDVTDGVLARGELVESEARFRQLADAMPQIVWAARPDGRVDYWNRRWYEYTGLTERLSGDESWAPVIHPDDVPAVRRAWGESVGTGRPYEIENRVRRADGEYRWQLERALPVRDDEGNIVRWFGTTTDIHDRKRAAARDQFLLALDDAVRPLTGAPEITATYARLLGEHLGADRCAYADAEADEDTFNLTGDYNRPGVPSIVGRYRFAEFGAEVLRLMRADEPYVVEDVDAHQPPVGDLSAYRATMIRAVVCVPLHKGGRFVAAMAVHQRVPRRWTPQEVALVRHVAGRCWESIERSRVERTMRFSEARLRQMADAMPQMVWVTLADGYHEYYNRRWYEFTGMPEGSTDGVGWNEMFHPDDRQRAWATWRQSLATGELYEIEYRLRHHSGVYRWTLGRALPVRNERGEIERWFGTCTDIDALRRLTDEREGLLASERKARAEAETANRAKDRFLAVLSHELRTPLTPVAMAATAMEVDPRLPFELREDLGMIRRNVELETRLIDDLLDLSRVTSGKLRLNRQLTDVHRLIQHVLETVGPELHEKQLRVERRLAAANDRVDADPARLQQTLWNLLKNSAKFTPAGGRVVIGTRNDAGQLHIEVGDTGKGIAAEVPPTSSSRSSRARLR